MTIKWGIIAPGIIANNFAESMNFVNGSQIIAVGSRSEKRSKKFANRFNIENAYSSYDEVLMNDDVDIVYIASPHNFHFEQAMKALEYEKAVLCEKPITVNYSQCKQLVEKAKEKKLFLMEAQWMRFMPVINEVKLQIQNGIIGEVLRIEADFSYRTDFDPDHRLFNPHLAGGALLDIGVYPLSFSLYIMDKLPITFEGECAVGNSEVDEHGSVTLKFDNNEIAVCTFGTRIDGSRHAVIRGTKGSIELNEEFYMATEANVITDDKIKKIVIPHRSLGYEWEIDEINKCLNEGRQESHIMSHQDSLDQMTILDDLRKRWGIKYPFE